MLSALPTIVAAFEMVELSLLSTWMHTLEFADAAPIDMLLLSYQIVCERQSTCMHACVHACIHVQPACFGFVSTDFRASFFFFSSAFVFSLCSFFSRFSRSFSVSSGSTAGLFSDPVSFLLSFFPFDFTFFAFLHPFAFLDFFFCRTGFANRLH